MVRKKQVRVSRVPVTLVTGFLGAGKTTLIQSLLVQAWRAQTNLSVVVNDLSDLDIDGVILEETDVVGPSEGTLVSITGSSVHERLDELARACTTVLENDGLTHLLIETSGSTRPGPVLTFLRKHLRLRLRGFITVVDAAMLRDDLDLGRTVASRVGLQSMQGVIGMETLLAEQILFATDIYLTKTDKLTQDDVKVVVGTLHQLNPNASVSAVTFGNVRLHTVLDLPPYDHSRVRLLTSEIAARDRTRSEPDPIVSFVIDDPRPFHPTRLWETFTTAMPQELYRSKGFTWLPTRDDQVLVWNQAAGGIGLEILGYWKAGILAHGDNDLTEEEVRGLRQKVTAGDPVFGDRRTQITVIGPRGPAQMFLELLETCLLTEIEVERWQAGDSFDDPWPTRRVVLDLPTDVSAAP